ncbi:uncharacterized protein AMSG_01660 [Thecamonas trahens ATCC 50062]|uniref:ATP-dependent DNA helicase n=1 Tax=Thecamonas trahens ATCC 50062 TaxID=461836 RepID=A0A0L0DTL1_THETB|nr:hypothetical protein AMSG_01660 [Thecamonas trahens ATCC 50062]KNC54808.1 hypothetical protein AMSG_01660 [Thecamonas trahens ATCC 50062]|eukprot:XP_013761707.1 hypothetical protein AMSG_01660 [Thecamonas trahens ATCC 50062]
MPPRPAKTTTERFFGGPAPYEPGYRSGGYGSAATSRRVGGAFAAGRYQEALAGRERGLQRAPSAAPREPMPVLDEEAAKVWVYPAQVEKRDYQFVIAKRALLANTLVCLPTGLGKTLIAAVVQRNYFDWYPRGRIVFISPTRPLTFQQLRACHALAGIPMSVTAEMTAACTPPVRAELWKTKRVFYCTAQSLNNDIRTGICPAHTIVCVVVDEAHRATGNHAYVQAVNGIAAAHAQFRVLALTATPGSTIKAVQGVIDNLHIAHMEVRDNNALDVIKYTHSRKNDIVVVPSSRQLDQALALFGKTCKEALDLLASKRAFWVRDIAKVTSFQLIHARNEWRMKSGRSASMQDRVVIEGSFALALTLSQVYALLSKYSFATFHAAVSRIINEVAEFEAARAAGDAEAELSATKLRIANTQAVLQTVRLAGSFVGDGILHPKMTELVRVVSAHFAQNGATGTDTRIMVFSSFRDSVDHIVDVLASRVPQCKPMRFVGQAAGAGGADVIELDTPSKRGKGKKRRKSRAKAKAGLSQKEQQQIIAKFRSGGYATLVSTSIGEEGLDIGEVDLIVCYDSPSSVSRMVQRQGRTGRKRDGRVVTLLMAGHEKSVYDRAESKRKAMYRTVLKTSNFCMPNGSPRMLPPHITPQVRFVNIAGNVDSPDPSTLAARNKKRKRSAGKSGVPRSLLFTDASIGLTPAQRMRFAINGRSRPSPLLGPARPLGMDIATSAPAPKTWKSRRRRRCSRLK